ncbi:helix-turn-helix transcriptional regulator [Asticcacaulis taihuensis]|uniref:Transcriptional regulator, AlpA family n=1 Tax=Asticcacaulis taihuensis TaxID=260084 RepID=A0A1G4SVT9_9CAUL|nr:helix-turn-helix domain-containing protein [Asticcacaulis taihuensis]SCW73334.1 transcriptional regulator, AlpA family [Asticcacaulis taihuensis]
MKEINHRKPLLHEMQVAKIMGISPAWLQRKRWEGSGPPYVKYGRAVRYEPDALDAWIQAHRVSPEGGVA